MPRLLLLACWMALLFAVDAAFCQTNGERLQAIASAVGAGDFDQAMRLLQPALKQSPQSPQLWALEGLALSGQEHPQEALAAFRTALRISPDFLPALEGAAQIEYEAGSQQAVPLLQHLLRLRPHNPTTHAMLVVLAYKRGDCVSTIEQFHQGGSTLEAQPQILQQVGDCLLRQKHPQQAVTIFQKALAADPSNTRARFRLAAVQLAAEQPRDAIDTITSLLQSPQPDVATLQLAAAAYEATGDTPRAVQTLRDAIVAYPKQTDLYLDFADLCFDHQSFQVGVDMINAGLTALPEAAALYVARGVLSVQLEDYDAAERDFEKADALDPTRSVGAAAQGLQAEQNNDPARALATVRAKLVSRPNDAFLLYLQADILAQEGPQPDSHEFRTAVASAKRAIAIQPDLVAARDTLAKLYLRAGQNQAAIDQCRQALDRDPKDQTALYRLIQALRKTNDTRQIPELLKRLADLREQNEKSEREHDRYKLVEPNPR